MKKSFNQNMYFKQRDLFKLPLTFRISCFSHMVQLMNSIFLLIVMFMITHFLKGKKENISLLRI